MWGQSFDVVKMSNVVKMSLEVTVFSFCFNQLVGDNICKNLVKFSFE